VEGPLHRPRAGDPPLAHHGRAAPVRGAHPIPV
jgi:hypothetical protein